MAATINIHRRRRLAAQYAYPVLAGVRIYGGTAVGVTADLVAVPAGHAACVALIGFADDTVDNRDKTTGSQQLGISKGTFDIVLPGALAADIGKPVYAVDDNTFTLTAGTSLKIGIVDAIDASGVWLKI